MATGIAPLEIGFDAAAAVSDALASPGRTEDVRFAPSGRRLALACYTADRILLADVEITVSSSGPEIAVTGLEQLASPDLRDPHGIDFLDDDTLIVANRTGGIGTFRLPPPGGPGGLTRIGPTNGAAGTHDSPGSVLVRSIDSGQELFVCENWANKVVRHTLGADGALSLGEVVLRKWLDVPDGIAMSSDGQWVAVSNHNAHSVFVYAYSSMNELADPEAILRGIHYPHGLRFTANGHLVVADAGAPYVHVFVSEDGGWQGVTYPTVTIRVMDDDTFARGHREPQEGGPKGMDIDPRTNVLVVTSEFSPLAFFDLDSAVARAEREPDEDALIRYELTVLAETGRIKAATADARARLNEIQQTKAWRLTKPARSAHEAMRRLKSRRRR